MTSQDRIKELIEDPRVMGLWLYKDDLQDHASFTVVSQSFGREFAVTNSRRTVDEAIEDTMIDLKREYAERT